MSSTIVGFECLLRWLGTDDDSRWHISCLAKVAADSFGSETSKACHRTRWSPVYGPLGVSMWYMNVSERQAVGKSE